MKIILLEPDKVLASTYRQALLSAGHKVIMCASAQAAIFAADDMRPDLVITELQLAGHSGIEFLYEFRSYDDWLQVPVMALTSVPAGEFAASWQLLRDQLGVQAYHYKPLTSLQTLLRSVRAFAGRCAAPSHMNQLTAEGIVLSRLNYGEADRIIKLITPEAGKISLMARGVRKSKSKLAGAIELFSVSSLTYIRGRGDLGTLVSARLEKHYGNVVKQLDRVQLGYDLIKILDRATEDEAESGYFTLLQNTFIALDDTTIDVAIIRFWFTAQLLQLAGFAPNLHTDIGGNKLEPKIAYSFDFDNVCFAQNNAGKFKADHIKLLRLGFADSSPRLLGQITNITELLPIVTPPVQTMLSTYIRI